MIVSTAVKLAAGFVLLKYLAWEFGPTTFGLLSQVMGTAAIFYLCAGGGITNGIIRNLAAVSSENERHRWMSAATTITVLSSIILAAVALALALFGSNSIFGNARYAPIFVGIAGAQALVGFGNLALAYFSGTGHVRTFAIVQIVANLLSLLMLVALTESLGLAGAIIGLIVGPALVGVISLGHFCRRKSNVDMLRIAWDRPLLRELLSYAAVMASSVAAVPVAQLLIRMDMSERLGWQMVGYWQAVAKISDASMLFIGMILINYLLPQLSRRNEAASALRFLARFGSLLLGLFVVGCGVIYLARDYLLLIIYSEQFLTASSLLLPQLIGDTLKTATLLLYYYLMSRGRVLVVFFAELVLGVALYGLYLVLVPFYEAIAPIYAYVAAYAVVLVAMLVLLVVSGTSTTSSPSATFASRRPPYERL